VLRELTPERVKIGDAMIWCLDHAESAEEIVECITESLSILQTPVPKKIARLFLISDILFNSSAKVPNASFFRKYFEVKLPEIFTDIQATYKNIEGRLKADKFKQKVMACFHAWEDWAVYPNEFLIKMQNIFLGLVNAEKVVEDYDGAPMEDVDGLPMEDIDGAPLDAAPLDGEPMKESGGEDNGAEEDIDGMPLSDIDGQPLSRSSQSMDDGRKATFKYEPSKWETVDQSLLEEQAMTTSKWENPEEEDSDPGDDEDLDGQPMEEDDDTSQDYGRNMDDDSRSPYNSRSREGSSSRDMMTRQEMTEERRAKLREIELKVMKYQDEIEAGRRSRKPGMSLAEQVESHRKKLLQKEEERIRGKERDRERDRRRKEEREKVKEWERAREKERVREGVGPREERGRERDVRREDKWEERRDDRWEQDRKERSPSYEYESPFQKPRRRSVSNSPSPAPNSQARRARSRSPLSPPAAYRTDSPASSSGRSGSRQQRSRSRSPSKRRRRSRSPKRVGAKSPKRSRRTKSRSRSRSPSRHRHKHKKGKR